MIFNKSFKMIGFVNGIIKYFRNPFNLKTLYSSLVESNLEFDTPIRWTCSELSVNLAMFKRNF